MRLVGVVRARVGEDRWRSGRADRPAVLPDRAGAALADPAAGGSLRRGAERAGRLGVLPQERGERAADDFCTAIDPAYLGSGALTYVIQRLARCGATSDSLVAWREGRLTTLLSFPAGLSPFYDMTAQGQAIWADAPAGTKPAWTIWRWSGGAPVKIIALSPYYGVGPIAW